MIFVYIKHYYVRVRAMMYKFTSLIVRVAVSLNIREGTLQWSL